MNSSLSHPPSRRKTREEKDGREHFIEGTVARPKSFLHLLGFASVVVAVFQTGQWLLDLWNFFFPR